MENIKNWFIGVFDKIKGWWLGFEAKNPKLSQWVREGGLFVLVSNFVTILRALLMTFLTPAFISLVGDAAWGWPEIDVTLFNITFTFNIVGYEQKVGGIAYFYAFVIGSLVCEIINFLMQRKFTFRSNGNIAFQGSIYFLAWCFVTVIVNAVNSVWAGVASEFLPGLIYNLGTTFLQGGISMVIFFFVNKIIFTDAPKVEEKV